MKTLGLIGIVVALHCAVIGSVFFISGCGTTSKMEAPSATPLMPPPQAPMVQPPVPTPAPEAQLAGGGEYIVQAGDTLSAIAKRCRVTQAELIAANQLADPNKLRIGHKLILPAHGRMPPAVVTKAAEKTKAEKAQPGTVSTAEGANEYVVKPGDNLSKIAAHCGVKVSALREVNKLQSDKIMIGQKLVIPETRQAAPAESTTPAAMPAAGGESQAVEPAPLKKAPAVTPAPTPVPAPVPAVKGTEVAPVAGASTRTTSISSSGLSHTVDPGEDLSSIAKLYAVTVEEIAELNQLAANCTVQVGQRLKIP